jgi:hypothetical protein
VGQGDANFFIFLSKTNLINLQLLWDHDVVWLSGQHRFSTCCAQLVLVLHKQSAMLRIILLILG